MRFCKRDAVELAILFVINFLFPYISRWLCDIDSAFSMEVVSCRYTRCGSCSVCYT